MAEINKERHSVLETTLYYHFKSNLRTDLTNNTSTLLDVKIKDNLLF